MNLTLTRRPAMGWRAALTGLAPADVLPLARVLCTAVLVEVAIRRLPLPIVSRLFGVSITTPPPPQATPYMTAGERRRVHWAYSVMDRWPFGTGMCLRRSLVIGHVIRRLEPVLRVGVARDPHGITAHAWLEVPGAATIDQRQHVGFPL